MDRGTKPKKTAKELVEMLRDEKGVTFDFIGEEDAVSYFTDVNNYLRTTSYRKNYEKHQSGVNKGKYIHLDFAYLLELSKLDMYLRRLAFHMCIDIEHALKTMLVTAIENNPNEDGYHIVDLFFNQYPGSLSSIEEKADSVFTGQLIEKYFELCSVYDNSSNFGAVTIKTRVLRFDCPVWVLVEIIGFGDLLKLISLYNETYPMHPVKAPSQHILRAVKSLRNACGHNNCLLNNLNKGVTRPPQEITQFVARMPTIGKEERTNKLSCRPMFELVCMFKVYHEIVSSKVRQYGFDGMWEFANGRLMKNVHYFDTDIVVRTSFDFLKKVLDNLR